MIVKVIAVCFSGNRQSRTPKSDPSLKFPDHYQDILCEHDALRQLRETVQFEIDNEPGEKVDTIIVNNDIGFSEGNEYISSLDGRATKYGRIYTLNRPNIGWSFGAYSDAYKTFRGRYDFWLFTEEDILVGGPNYARRLLTKWNEGGTDFLALVKAVDHSLGRHAGGGVGFTSHSVLEKIWEEHNCLPHYKEPSNPNADVLIERDKVIRAGEVAFTNTIIQQGGTIVDFGPNDSWSLEDNLCVPYYHYKHA